MKIKDFPNLFDLSNAPLKIEIEVVPTGSKHNCNPPVLNTDEDYLIFALDLEDFEKYLTATGYVLTVLDPANPTANSMPKRKGKDAADTFKSWRKGVINLIVTDSRTYFERHSVAGKLCKHLNLLDKADRILLYHAVMYGIYDEQYATARVGTNKKVARDIDWFAINRMFA